MEKDKDSPMPKTSFMKLTGKAGVELSLLGGVKVSVAKRCEQGGEQPAGKEEDKNLT